jgi:hypothetical protein
MEGEALGKLKFAIAANLPSVQQPRLTSVCHRNQVGGEGLQILLHRRVVEAKSSTSYEFQLCEQKQTANLQTVIREGLFVCHANTLFKTAASIF